MYCKLRIPNGKINAIQDFMDAFMCNKLKNYIESMASQNNAGGVENVYKEIALKTKGHYTWKAIRNIAAGRRQASPIGAPLLEEATGVSRYELRPDDADLIWGPRDVR